jgi:hypothetical protein
LIGKDREVDPVGWAKLPGTVMTVAQRRAILPTRLRRESSHMDKTPVRRAMHAELDPTTQISGLRKFKLTSCAPISSRPKLGLVSCESAANQNPAGTAPGLSASGSIEIEPEAHGA